MLRAARRTQGLLVVYVEVTIVVAETNDADNIGSPGYDPALVVDRQGQTLQVSGISGRGVAS